MGPTWGRQDPGGPHVGPMILALWDILGDLLNSTPMNKHHWNINGITTFFHSRRCIWYCVQNAGHFVQASYHDDVIKWKHFPRYWPFARGIHRSPVNSSHKGQWRGALMFSLICVWINGWLNKHGAGDLRRSQAHYDFIVMIIDIPNFLFFS